MRRKIYKTLLSLVMVVGMILQVVSSTVVAEGKPVEATIKKFEIQNLSGQKVDKVFVSDRFYLNMDWDASSNGANLNEGDYFDITLPDKMKFPSDTTATEFNIYGEDGKTVIAKAKVIPGPGDKGGKVRVTFTKWVKGKENVKGNVRLAALFDKEQVKKNEKNKFDITVNGKVTPTEITVEGPKELPKDEMLAKWGQSGANANEAEWWVRVNYKKAHLTNAVITDHLTGGTGDETYIPGSFKLVRVEYNSIGDYSKVYENVNLDGKLTLSADKKTFTINLGEVKGDQYRLIYKTTYTPGTTLHNNVKITSNEVNTTTSGTHISAESGGSGTGNLANKIKLIKVDAEDNTIKLANAVFEVTAPDGKKFELKTGADGTITSSSLTSGTYKVKEKTAPTGYLLNEEEFTLIVSPKGGAIQTITNKRIKINISGKKTWDDSNNQDGKRPAKIKVNLLDDDKKVVQTKEVTPDGDGNWNYTFENVDEYNVKTGKKINYTVSEEKVDGYSTEINGHNIKNSYTPSKTSIQVTKAWEDKENQDGKRPESVTIKLLADGVATDKTLTLTKTNNWTGSFTGLDEYKDGKKIVYSIEEEDVGNGYSGFIAQTSETGFNVINKRETEKTSVEGSKTWNDNNNQDGKRPKEITINLLKNGTKIDSKKVTEAEGWKWKFENLDKYENGQEINYTISEEKVEGYTTEVAGYNVKNSYTPEKTGIQVTKAWEDKENQDGKRPESITIKLLADGVETDKTLTLTKENNWSGSFTNLDEYKDGKKIVYTIKEEPVGNGYITEIIGDAQKGFKVINTRQTEKVEVEGSKTWNDNNNQDGKRPKEITINLLKNGTVVDTKKVTEAEGWKWKFENLDKYENGKEINYTISEEKVEGYTTEVAGYNVKNSYTPGKTGIQVTKAWSDKENQDGVRPESVTVKLLADGVETDKTLTLTKANNWSGSFTDLDEYKDGKKIVYTIKEETVGNGYVSVVTGTAEDGFTVTNTRETEKVEIEGLKTWDDANNQDGKRPKEITINLLRNGKKVDSKKVTEAEGWKWKFENLDKFENGKEINYTISEEKVEGYTTEVNGYDVKNSYTPGKTSVQVTKAWADKDNQDGKRPESVTIKLLADGKETGKTLKLSKDNKWTGSFTDLDEYKDGKKIEYTIKEEALKDGYVSVVTGTAENGFTVTNTRETEKISVEGSKTWDDANNQDGKRPTEITINLLRNGKKVDSKKVTEAEGWKWKFENLDKYEGGKEINYTISEEKVEGYTTEVKDYNVKNSYTPGKTSVQVTKAWADKDNQDGKRPESVTIKLLADGKETGKTLKLSKDNKWTGSFTDLDEYKDGKKIEYTIKEVEVGNGYKTVITGNVKEGFVVTNVRTPNKPKPRVPQTGLGSSSVLYTALVGLSGAVLFAGFRRKKKED